MKPVPAAIPVTPPNAEWAAPEPLLLPAARLGRSLRRPRYLTAEAIFHIVRSGCAWRMLPTALPPWQTVFAHLRQWRFDGTLQHAHDRLRAMAREADGRKAKPSAAIIDSQALRATRTGGTACHYDAVTRSFGRKRHILVDAAGLSLLAHVHAAAWHDRLGARLRVGRAGEGDLPRLEPVWADGTHAGTFAH
ncbi:IS5 family transposase [Belnapia sp. T18]|uniref:IS5 family transposase n=1 Tax=Belnapia arida TaxID=2804533 RepID=A0ABS1UDD8_9PROT|nr:IS5 family transposase [Belnapia arida]